MATPEQTGPFDVAKPEKNPVIPEQEPAPVSLPVAGHEVHGRGGMGLDTSSDPEKIVNLTNVSQGRTGEIIPQELAQENAWRVEDERLETEVVSLSEAIGTKLREAATLIQELNAEVEKATGDVTGLSEAIEEAKQQVEGFLEEKLVLENMNASDREAGVRGGLSDGYIEKRRKTLGMFQELNHTALEVLEEIRVVVSQASEDSSRTDTSSNQGQGETSDNNQKASVKNGKRGGGSGNGGDGGDGGDGDDPKSGASIGDRSKAALLQAKAGARHAEDVSQTNIEAINEPNVPESFPLQYSREAALNWWYAERRTLNERIQAIRDDLDSWDKVVAVIQELGGEDMLTKALESFKHRDLAFDGRNRQVRDRLDAIEAGNLEQFQKPDEPERNLIQARDYYLKAQYMGHRELLAIGEEVLREVRANPPQKRAVESSERRILFSERLERIYALAEEWKQLMDQFGPEPKRFSEEVAKQLGQESVLNVKRFMDELAKQGKEHGWKGEISKGDKTVAVNKLKFLEKQVAAARVVIERDKRLSQEDADVTTPPVMATEPASSSVPEVDLATPSVSSEPVVSEALDTKIVERLEKLKSLAERFRELYDQYNSTWEKEDERSETQTNYDTAGALVLPKADKRRNLLRNSVHSLYGDFMTVSNSDNLEKRAQGEGKEGEREYKRLHAQLKDLVSQLENIVNIAEEERPIRESDQRIIEDFEFREKLGRAEDLIAMWSNLRNWCGIKKWKEEFTPALRARLPKGHIDAFGFGKWLGEREVAHHWQGKRAAKDREQVVYEALPDLERLLEVAHELAKEWKRDGKIIKEEMAPDKFRERMEERRLFENNLLAKVQEFVQDMDTELQQQGKDYAYRFGAISSHMSMVVNAFIEDLRGDLVLSEAERKSMIKKSISSIEIAD